MPHNNEDTEIIKFTHNGNNVSTYTKTKIDTLLSAYVLNSASTQFAGNANTATNAQNDGSGNNIENTYATKQWVEGKNYLTTITSGMITSALGFTPANSSSLNNYLLKTGGTITGNLLVPATITTHWVQADASSGQPGGFRAQAVNGVQFFETFTDNNNDGGICLRSRNGNAGYMKYSDNLGLNVVSSVGGAWNEGLYIINSTVNSFATMTLGTPDKSRLFAMVCNTDSNNYHAYLETKNPSGGLSQYNMPLGKTGTIALTSDLIKSTTFNSPSFETLVQFIATHNVVSIRSVYYGDDYTRYSSINYEVLDDENAGYSGTFWIGTSRVNNFSGYTVIVYYI
ncbi:MAG: hypothetical protein J6I69_02420 [Bacilli bacterium]|nr:hypothetical protein [Bacilli bacterium]